MVLGYYDKSLSCLSLFRSFFLRLNLNFIEFPLSFAIILYQFSFQIVFLNHPYFQECLKEKIYLADRQRGRSAGVAQRGRGRCPHGPPVKCKYVFSLCNYFFCRKCFCHFSNVLGRFEGNFNFLFFICRNFPNCPGEKCYYFHGYCRYDKLCVKKECPFDHTDRPRICLSCLRDYKVNFAFLIYDLSLPCFW